MRYRYIPELMLQYFHLKLSREEQTHTEHTCCNQWTMIVLLYTGTDARQAVSSLQKAWIHFECLLGRK